MNKAVLIAAALVLAPLAGSTQQVPDTKDREPSYVGKSGERAAPSERTDDLSQTAVGDRVLRRSKQSRMRVLLTSTIFAARSHPVEAVSHCACWPTKTG